MGFLGLFGASNSGYKDFEVSVRIGGFKRIEFDKRELKAAFRKAGQEVRREARRLIARRAISSPGQFPGRDTGAMSRSIKVVVGSGGGYVKIAPYATSEMHSAHKDFDFYPAYLNYGTSRGIKPRKNFMVAALGNRRSAARSVIVKALKSSLVAK